MARTRNIKPGFFTNDKLLDCHPLARILFAGLWCHADREGRIEDRPKKIKIEILPADDCDVEQLLSQLQAADVIQRYQVGTTKCIQILAFHKHQKPHVKEAPSDLPAPPKVVPSTNLGSADTDPGSAEPGLIPSTLSLPPHPSIPSPPVPSEPAPKGARVKRGGGDGLDADFDAWWAQYPKRKAKKAARFAYGKARTQGGISAADLLAGAMRYAAERANQDPQYTALPATWLNQGRWEDEPEKPHVASLGRKAAVLSPDEELGQRRTQLAGGVAALRRRWGHDPGGEGPTVAGGEASAGRDEPEDHARADGRGTRPDGGLGGDVQPAEKGLGQGAGFLHGGAEKRPGRSVVDGHGTGASEPQDGDASAAATGNRSAGVGRDGTPRDAQEQAVPGAALPGGGPRDGSLPRHDTRAEGGSGSDAGRLEQQIQLANRELTDQPTFLRRDYDIEAHYEAIKRRTA